ncbi:MAG: ATP synthase subunit I [Gammaproteobacteria bacterium]|nr:ATP synthase subunit I [Gammaproteobacteria bacterium]
MKDFKPILFIQIGTAVLMVVFWGVWEEAGERAAWSASLGSGIALIPSWVFAGILLGAKARTKRFLWRLYLGEGIKWILTAMLFWVCIVWLDVAMLPLLVSFGGVQMSLWVSLLTK